MSFLTPLPSYPHAGAGWASPYYNEKHKKIRDAAFAFVEREIKPHVDEWEEKRAVPNEVLRKAAKAGIVACLVPELRNIPGVEELNVPVLADVPLEEIDCFAIMLVNEALCSVGSTGVLWGLVGGLGIGLPPVLRFGSPYLRGLVGGPVLRGEKRICLCITEPSGGSDVARLKTTARRSACGKFFIVNGLKKWITNGIWADFFTVAVRTGSDESGMKGVSLLLIEKEREGVRTRQMQCSGAWSSGTTFIEFVDVTVPVENLIGKENEGFRLIMSNFNHERFAIAVECAVFSAVCLREASACLAERIRGASAPLAGGGHRAAGSVEESLFKTRAEMQSLPLSEWRLVAAQDRLMDLSSKVWTLRAWVESLCFQMSRMEPQEAFLKLGAQTALLKVQSTRIFEAVAAGTSEVMREVGVTRGTAVERLYREVRAFAIGGGSEEVMGDLAIRQQRALSERVKQALLVSFGGEGQEEENKKKKAAL